MELVRMSQIWSLSGYGIIYSEPYYACFGCQQVLAPCWSPCSLGEFVCSDDFLLLVPAKRNKARGTITVHLTMSSIKVAFNFINMWTPLRLNPALKDCHLVQGFEVNLWLFHVVVLKHTEMVWRPQIVVERSLQKGCKKYHLEGKRDRVMAKETTFLFGLKANQDKKISRKSNKSPCKNDFEVKNTQCRRC